MLINKAALIVILFLTLAGCSKEETSYEDLDGETGNVPGSFDVRLSTAYRDQIDSISDKISAFSGGLVASVTSRFEGDDESTEASLNGFAEGTKLSDLLKIELPGTDNEEINKSLFNGPFGAGFNEKQSLYLGLKNGFQIQLKLFQKSK